MNDADRDHREMLIRNLELRGAEEEIGGKYTFLRGDSVIINDDEDTNGVCHWNFDVYCVAHGEHHTTLDEIELREWLNTGRHA